jgi:hypothetical protein
VIGERIGVVVGSASKVLVRSLPTALCHRD